MGTPDFAVEPLRRLLENKHDVRAVVTVADKPSGRGLKINQSPVKEFAITNNIPVLQPVNLSDPTFLSDLKSFNADLFIVVAFRKLPDAVWQMPRLGCFNLHASLLPQYRGAAPINHAIINGEKATGVTTFFLNSGIDTGKMIMQKQIPVGPDETAGELHDRLMNLGAGVVLETVNLIIEGNVELIDQPQSTEGLKKAPKLFRENCKINWSNDAKIVHDFIRGLSPYPGAYSTLDTSDGLKEIKILKTQITGIKSDGMPGLVQVVQNRILVACNDELLEIHTLQPPGKKSMLTSDFLRGTRSELRSFANA